MARHKTVAVKKPKRASGNGGGSSGNWRPTRPAENKRGRRGAVGRPRGGYRFIDQPPSQDMKKKSPESAPRLYAWLVDGGFVEPVNTVSRRKRGGRISRGRQ